MATMKMYLELLLSESVLDLATMLLNPTMLVLVAVASQLMT